MRIPDFLPQYFEVYGMSICAHPYRDNPTRDHCEKSFTAITATGKIQALQLLSPDSKKILRTA